MGTHVAWRKLIRLQKKHGLKDIYDAAHAFGVEQNKHSILNHGDLSILSFHATKVFNTIKGGAIISHTAEMEHHIDNLKNFGFRGELVVEEPGINAKMNELQAAYGLLQLNSIDAAILECKAIADQYRKGLKDVPGIRILEDLPETKHNYAYFPILVDDKKYSHDRDALYEMLKRNLGQ
jgi:dTDP-4-amino-4,6-dideoxygalactose transaminase